MQIINLKLIRAVRALYNNVKTQGTKSQRAILTVTSKLEAAQKATESHYLDLLSQTENQIKAIKLDRDHYKRLHRALEQNLGVSPSHRAIQGLEEEETKSNGGGMVGSGLLLQGPTTSSPNYQDPSSAIDWKNLYTDKKREYDDILQKAQDVGEDIKLLKEEVNSLAREKNTLNSIKENLASSKRELESKDPLLRQTMLF